MHHEDSDYVNANRGAWIQTDKGQKFHFWGHDETEIDIETVARGLSQTARWRGMYKKRIAFYSVAQHCVLAAKIAPQFAKRYALLHDAAEWPLGDMPKPIKADLPDYRRLENFILLKCCKRFQVPMNHHVIGAVKRIDNYLLFTEGEQLLANPEMIKEWNVERLECRWAPKRLNIRPWGPERARREFLASYREIWFNKHRTSGIA